RAAIRCCLPSWLTRPGGAAISLGPLRARHQVDPPRLHKMERTLAIRQRLERQPAAQPQAITHRHRRPRRREHERNPAGRVSIDHQDHADGRAVPISEDLPDVAHQHDLVMMSWGTHRTLSPQPSRPPLIPRLFADVLGSPKPRMNNPRWD